MSIDLKKNKWTARTWSAGLYTGFIALVLSWNGGTWAADIDNGKRIYAKHCQNCHGARGQGQLPGTPDFSRGERLMQPDSQLVEVLRNGKGMMPAFRAQLQNRDLLDVIAYLRTLRR